MGTFDPSRRDAMTEAEIKNELQNLQFQLVLLQEEHAKTRFGWLYWMRNTGFLLLVLGISMFFGIWKAALNPHVNIETNPLVASLGLIGIFLFGFGLWLVAFSLRPLAERLMKTAPRW